jgi:hypothetical protein
MLGKKKLGIGQVEKQINNNKKATANRKNNAIL